MKPKEYYERHSITIDEQLAQQYAKMRKSEILLHQYILSIVDDDGFVKRNMEAAARELGCSKRWLYEAETLLIMRELLSTKRRNSKRFWKVVRITDEAENSVVDGAPAVVDDETEAAETTDDGIAMEKKKRRGFFSWLRRRKDEK